jgi:hypothetical protein
MQPYYFPFVVGHGKRLQGYFDYRPRNIDEATVAAFSTNGGRTWQFQQEVLELTDACPPADTTDLNNDNGLGHPFVLNLGGTQFLYTLDRRDGHIDVDGFVIHVLSPQPGQPLSPAPEDVDPDTAMHTTGLLNPDAIIGEVPETFPRKILYIQKQRKADVNFPAAQLCLNNSAYTPPLTSTNDDITTPRLAETSDGIHFTDLGPLQGLNDPKTVAPAGTRWIGSGSLLRLPGHGYGLFFSGGTCLDADSDAFHYIGYAESEDLIYWTVVNGITNPIASVAPVTVTYQGTPLTLPATSPIIGYTQGWFAGRVYGPQAIVADPDTLTVIFAGYHTPKPKDALGDYRTIGWFSLKSSRPFPVVDDGDRQD